MMHEDWQWHYVRQNEACRYPRRIICFDSEASRTINGDAEQHRFLLAVASFDLIDARTKAPRKTEWVETDEPYELWEWIASHTRKRERTCVFAHNLGYDLRICQAFTILPKLGWRLKFISLDSRRCYARFSNGEATLTFSDSVSYFPKSLDVIAQEIGLEKTALPEPGESPDKYYARCRSDVTILRTAMLTLLDWLETNDSGNFKATGPAQAWATYRHRFLRRHTLLSHRDEEALEAERSAAWTGRTEVWRHGEYHYPLEEWDYRLAYATLAAELNVPSRLLGGRTISSKGSITDIQRGTSTLYKVRATTDRPTIPARSADGIFWPVGTFETCLWDIEARLAIENGATIEPSYSWIYKSTPLLKEWAEWVISQLSDDTADIPPLIRIMLKHWARCLIGRFGMQYPEWRYVGNTKQDELVHFDCFDMQNEDVSEYLQIATDLYESVGKRAGHDTAPAVMSYIVAMQRVRIWEAIQAAGESEVFYCDTDSLLVTPNAGKRLADLQRTRGHSNLMRKSQYEHVHLYAPRCIVTDNEPRISGLARRATATGERHYKAQVWQSLSDSLKNGDPSTVRVTPRSFRIPSHDHRRIHLDNGMTIPYTVPIN